eukprot:Sspe_Gene.64676::Locus_38313_Transcript_1_1_Confidence_1.000_Length_1231::g.64676::m.64676
MEDQGCLDKIVEFGRQVMCCVCCLLCAGPILIVIGLLFLNADDTRGEKVKEYNKAVKAWKASGYNTAMQYRNRLWVGQGSPSQWGPTSSSRPTGATAFEPLTSEDKLSDSNKDDLETYTSYIHWEKVTSYTCIRCGTAHSLDATVVVSPSDSPGNGWWTTATSVRPTARMVVKVTESSETKSKSSSSSKKSKTTTTYTDYYYGMTAMGAVLSLGNSSVGMEANPWVFGNGEATYNGRRDVSYDTPKQLTSTYSFNTMRFVVRSSDDPYVKALELTSGSLNFGMTIESKRSLGVILLILGIALVCCICAAVAGVAFMLGGSRREKVMSRIRNGKQSMTDHMNHQNFVPLNQPYQQMSDYSNNNNSPGGMGRGQPAEGYPPQGQGYPPQGQGYPP